jgi:hypothetical protein
LRDIPVFAKAGAIVPQGPMIGWGGIEQPNHLTIKVFPGADGSFDLYEDEGNTNFYLDGAYAVTPLRLKGTENTAGFTMGPAEGSQHLLPQTRQVELRFCGYNKPATVQVMLNGKNLTVEHAFDADLHQLTISGIQIAPIDRLEVVLTTEGGSLADRSDPSYSLAFGMVKHFRMENNAKEELAKKLPDLVKNPQGLGSFLPMLNNSQMRALLETLTGAGLDYSRATGEPLLVLWNRCGDEKVTYHSALNRVHQWWRYSDRCPYSGGTLPRFMVIRPRSDFGEGDSWKLILNYYGLYTQTIDHQDQ